MKYFFKRTLLFILLIYCGGEMLYSQSKAEISGIVKDKTNEPLIGANVFIYKTIEGGITNNGGKFKFVTTKTEADTVTLIVSYLGFKDYKITSNVSRLKNLEITLELKDIAIDEVVVVASSFNFGSDGNKLKKMNSLDIVMTGSSNGDIYAALQSLPGTQKVGENGRLYVRGGESDETQTFINGMHVLEPYTTNAENSVQRSRFSPFLFKGINLTLGGYGAEYGQALSSVLPMQTTDVSSGDKLGISVSPFSFNLGGTISQKKSSISFNGDYMNMHLYNKAFPDKYNWVNPYQKISGQGQYKIEFNPNNILKVYLGYDYTSFKQKVEGTFDKTNKRNLSLREHNVYINTTYRSFFNNGYSLFLGAAGSIVKDKMDNALVNDDDYKNNRQEIHLKATVDKSFSNIYKTSFGGEAFLRKSVKDYSILQENIQRKYDLGYDVLSFYTDNNLKLHKGLYFNFSGRMEYQTNNKKWTLLPRTTLSYIPNNSLQFSVIYGSYSQSTKDDILALNRKDLKQELSNHFIFSMAYNKPGLVFRIEPYYKKYKKLPLLEDGIYLSKGYGHSKGIDLFLEEEVLIKNLRSTIAYSYNDSKRLYLDYPVLSQPQYATSHNFNVSFRYYLSPIKTYVGASNLFASGRPYHNPNKTGYMNSKTSPYNSLDLNLTFLLKPNIILYTSVTNILGRNNIFNYNYSSTRGSDNIYHGVPVVSSRERFFYVGLFISLNNTKAYEISNF